jgi:hypothetical protein
MWLSGKEEALNAKMTISNFPRLHAPPAKMETEHVFRGKRSKSALR